MIFAFIEDTTTNNDLYCTLKTYTSYTDMIRDTFPPDSNTVLLIDTGKPPHGKTYEEKKDTLQSQAIQYSSLDPEVITYCDLWEIIDYFHKYGKKYGLLKEFKENAII